MKRIRQTILDNGTNILNVYFTAGYPTLDSTETIIKALADNGVDLIELGLPYSDPLADGPTIQHSSEVALKNGQTLKNIFAQVKQARQSTAIPIIMMGYFNQLLQYGEDRFLSDAQKAGIQGLIIPDMPMDIYERHYIHLFEKYDIEISFLITPMTSEERILQANRLSSAFLYVVSQSSITGKNGDISTSQVAYFEKIKNMNLSSPTLIGFGIHDKVSRQTANQYSNGVIIGSAFIRALKGSENIPQTIAEFIGNI